MATTTQRLAVTALAFFLATVYISPDISAQKVIRQYRPVKGEPHLDFSFPDIRDGKLKKLSDFRGKKVLLLHFASW